MLGQLLEKLDLNMYIKIVQILYSIILYFDILWLQVGCLENVS